MDAFFAWEMKWVGKTDSRWIGGRCDVRRKSERNGCFGKNYFPILSEAWDSKVVT